MSINLIKLVVGISDLHEFAAHQRTHVFDYYGQRANSIWTRHNPKRSAELLNGGSAYRVIKNTIVARQRIIGFEKAEHPVKGTMCLIITDAELVTTMPKPKRPFQGWRYLEPLAAPKDIGVYDDSGDAPPSEMQDDLAAAGLL